MCMGSEEYEFTSQFNDKYNIVTRRMLRALSENSRASISDLSGVVKMSRRSTRSKLDRIEKEFGIHYTAELNENLLGLASRHVIAVKFDKKPDYGRIKELLQKSYIPQLAVSARGSFDLIIYAVSVSAKEYAHWDKSMQILLSEYGADWKPSEIVHAHLGFVPLRTELIDRLALPTDHKSILKILNADSRATFSKISKDLGMHFNTVAYNFNKMLKSGYINRFTITMDKPKDLGIASFFANFRPRDGFEKASVIARRMIMGDDQNTLVSRTLISMPIIGSYGLFVMGIFDDYKTAYNKYILAYKKIYAAHGIRMDCGEVTGVLLGNLPIRSVDNKKEYHTIVWDPERLG